MQRHIAAFRQDLPSLVLRRVKIFKRPCQKIRNLLSLARAV
jgi:hypothetical protein